LSINEIAIETNQKCQKHKKSFPTLPMYIDFLHNHANLM